MFIAVDDVRVRDLARARFGTSHSVLAASFRPRHIAWQRDRNSTDDALLESYTTTMSDYYALMQCEFSVCLPLPSWPSVLTVRGVCIHREGCVCALHMQVSIL